MDLITVDPRSLIENPENPRRKSPPDQADVRMEATARAIGILQPPVVREVPDGLMTIYGHRRVRGAIAARLPEIRVLVLGETESTLGEIARQAAAATGVTLVPDPAPAQGSFTRSDQYSFIRTGVPALSAKIGYRPGTPEAAADRAWRSTRYHGPADDLSQPFDREAAVGFNTYMAALIRAVADAPERPRWLPTSFFRRFAGGFLLGVVGVAALQPAEAARFVETHITHAQR